MMVILVALFLRETRLCPANAGQAANVDTQFLRRPIPTHIPDLEHDRELLPISFTQIF